MRTGSVQVLRAPDPGFIFSVRYAVMAMRFEPAEVDGGKVTQLVQQPFEFRLTRSTVAPRRCP